MAKLLFITQKVDKDDNLLGFVHDWISELSKNFDSVLVICLQSGAYELPSGVRVLSLGKERGISKIFYLFNFYRYIWLERGSYDSVFVHMNPIYVVLGSVFWKMRGNKIILWYTHLTTTWKLKLALFFATAVVTAEASSFPISSPKVFAIGHGINTDFFKKDETVQAELGSILFLGRISSVKRHLLLVESLRVLDGMGINFHCDIMGDYIPSTQQYFLNVVDVIKRYGLGDKISIVPPALYKDMPEVFNRHRILVSLTLAGSFDKAILSAMASKLSVVTTNQAFHEAGGVLVPLNDTPEAIAKTIYDAIEMTDTEKKMRGEASHQFVEKNHYLAGLAKKIRKYYD